MTTMPAQYYSRFDPQQNYDEHLFIAGRGLQSAELNEIQKGSASRIKSVADALFKDGDIIRDAAVVLNDQTGVAQCTSGAVYLRGAVRGVPPATITIPLDQVLSIGVRLTETVVTSNDAPALLDPATGTRNYDEPGAARLRVDCAWGWSGDGGTGEFFPVYSVEYGYLYAKEPPPNLDAVTQALARYDRDSAGGSYVVDGLELRQLPDVGDTTQYYSLSAGRARVFGYGVDFQTSRRLPFETAADLKVITNEPHLSSTASAQRVNYDRTPGTAPTEVSITAEKTVTLTHGVATGSQDPLPDTSILSIIEVKQGATTYVATTDYLLTSGKVNWSPAGAEPAPGSTYTVKYRYITDVTPTAVDGNGFTVTGAVSGTLILVTYAQKLPRYDRLCVDSDGKVVWISGVSSEYNPQLPVVPGNLLPLASIYQTWTSARTVTNDGVRVVPMPQLSRVESRMDYLAQLIAQQRLESNIHTREAGAKKGLFTDPFTDDTQRDAGTAQTAAIVEGELVLPITPTVHQMGVDITTPKTLPYVSTFPALEQTLRTGNMKINPYMAFDLVPARVKLTPDVDRWTEVDSTWLSFRTARWSAWRRIVNWAMNARQTLVNQSSRPAEFLRQISVSFRVEGFHANESLLSLKFDGITISTGSLAANSQGILTGSFTIPSGVPAGTKLVEITGAGGSFGSAVFIGEGTITTQTWRRRIIARRIDPLAQTFVLPAEVLPLGRGQISGLDLWFTAVPTTETRVQIRETSNGFPAETVIAEKILAPSEINATTNTQVLFSAPVSLIGNVEYAIVVLCNDSTGALAVAEMGKFDATAQRWITSQPYSVGVLLSSSNASTWTAHQDRDMTFRLLLAYFQGSDATQSLGSVSVTGATDLMLTAFSERPSSGTIISFNLTLPDASVVTLAEGQNVELAAPITGSVGITANLTGGVNASPILYPGTQLIAGVVASSADYVSRAIPAGASSTVKVIYEAIVPSGSTVQVYYKGPDVGDTWIAISSTANSAASDGFTEFIHTATGVNELSVQIKIVLNGTTAARPRVRDLRALVS